MIKQADFDLLKYLKVAGVGEHRIAMPELPINKNDILFINDDYAHSYWDREKIIKQQYPDIWFRFMPNETQLFKDATLTDDDGYLKTLNTEDSELILKLYEREFHRRTHGVHFKNGNEIVWLTGDHWFVLMWCKTKRPDKKSEYFDYRAYQRDFFYLIHHCNISEHILGCFWSKAKKTGVTNLMWLYFLNKATMSKNINLGNMNIDQGKGSKTFRDHFMYAYNGLPYALRPEFKSKSEADEARITFGRKAQGSKNRKANDSDELNTTVMTVATAMNSFDVDVFTDIWYDEAPKYKSDFGGIYRSNSGATRIQDYVVGKAWITSYTPEQAGDSFKSAKAIFYDSELKTITEDSNGKTKSMMICYHIPAHQSWASSFDKYGNCDEADALKKIHSEREQLKDRPQEYLKKIREYAIDKKEAWSVADSQSLFDPIRLAELEFDLFELQHSTRTFVEGELQWVEPLWEAGKKDKRPKGVFGRVVFVPLTEAEKKAKKVAKARLYEATPFSWQNNPLTMGNDEYGNLRPLPKFNHVAGIDPADFTELGSVEEGSIIGMYSMIVHDELYNTQAGRVATKIVNYEYYERPDNPTEWYQDIVKMIIYFGCLVVIESNNKAIAQMLRDDGLSNYMLWKNEDGIIVRYDHRYKSELKLITNNKSGNTNTISDLIVYIKSYLLKGDERYGEKDYGKTLKTERLIKQLKEFESDNTKKYDLVMAFGYCLMAHESYMALLNKPQNHIYQAHLMQTVVSVLSRSFSR